MSASSRLEALIGAAMGLGTGLALAGIPGRVSSGPPGSMNCRTFRKSHVAFVDGLLAKRRSAKMYEHLDRCDRCARLDTAVRRGLLVARNLPQIQPSADFMSRLQMRLHTLDGQWPARPAARAPRIMVRLGTAVAVAVGVVFVLYSWSQPAPLPVAPHGAVVAEAQAGRKIPRRVQPAAGSSALDGSLATTVPALFPGVAAGESGAPQLIDAAAHVPSLSP